MPYWIPMYVEWDIYSKMEYFVRNIEYIVWLQCKTISDTTSPWKHSIKQQAIPVWNILPSINFNNGVFHFRIQWQIDLPEGVFGIFNHDGLSIVNQLKKTLNELIFTMRKWGESGILCSKYWIYCLATMQNNKWHNVTMKALNKTTNKSSLEYIDKKQF